MATETAQSTRRSPGRALGIVDCDVHNVMHAASELKPYLPARYHERYDQSPNRVARAGSYITRPMPSIYRDDAWPARGGLPGSDVELLQEQLLDRWNIVHAILNPLDMLQWPVQGEFAGALHSALNDWVAEHWLERDDRFSASICITPEDGVRAAQEIRRLAGRHRYAQVLTTARSNEPFGAAKYWPIYEAAADTGLPVAVHTGGQQGGITGAGWPSYFFEFHVAWSHAFQAHIISLVASGVFDRFPELRFVLTEGGFSWVPALLWRLDRAWRTLGPVSGRTPRRPSEIVREHFYFTTQPIDDAEPPEQFREMLGHLAMDDRLLYSSDYPHWDFDAPNRAIPAVVGEELRNRIFRANAAALYRLDL